MLIGRKRTNNHQWWRMGFFDVGDVIVTLKKHSIRLLWNVVDGECNKPPVANYEGCRIMLLEEGTIIIVTSH